MSPSSPLSPLKSDRPECDLLLQEAEPALAGFGPLWPEGHSIARLAVLPNPAIPRAQESSEAPSLTFPSNRPRLLPTACQSLGIGAADSSGIRLVEPLTLTRSVTGHTYTTQRKVHYPPQPADRPHLYRRGGFVVPCSAPLPQQARSPFVFQQTKRQIQTLPDL